MATQTGYGRIDPTECWSASTANPLSVQSFPEMTSASNSKVFSTCLASIALFSIWLAEEAVFYTGF